MMNCSVTCGSGGTREVKYECINEADSLDCFQHRTKQMLIEQFLNESAKVIITMPINNGIGNRNPNH